MEAEFLTRDGPPLEVQVRPGGGGFEKALACSRAEAIHWSRLSEPGSLATHEALTQLLNHVPFLPIHDSLVGYSKPQWELI